MKIRIELDEDISEEEIVIRCSSIDERIKLIQMALDNISRQKKNFVFFKGETEYYMEIKDILFFETTENGISAHTINDAYKTKLKLYELENILPENFMRISKSTILNTDKIFSITRNITASSVVQFRGTHKEVYVSRNYFKMLKIKLDEKRKIYET